jgi:MATE family multidrug resistance protein
MCEPPSPLARIDRSPPGSTSPFRLVGALVRLAVPVAFARSGVMLLVVVDAIMVGHVSTRELAWFGIGFAPITTVLLTMIGLMMGTLVSTAAAAGAGDDAACGATWRRSLPYALVLGLAAAIVCSFGEAILAALGQSDEMAAGGGPVLRVLGLGIVPHLIFVTTTYFLEGIRRPLPGLVMMISANILNAGLNWLWVFGHAGFPAMGAVGSAWATTTARLVLAAGLVLYVWTMADHRRFAVRRPAAGGWAAWRRQRRIGYAAGASLGVEAFAFTVLGVFAGWLGPYPLAAHTIVLNLIAAVFMVAIGLGAATAVLVGMAHGRGDVGAVTVAGWTGLAVNTVVMAAFGLLFRLVPAPLVELYTDDAALVAVALPLMTLAAWILAADGGQGVMAAALRGRGDTWVATGLHCFSYIVVMIPVMAVLAFAGGRGVGGLYEGVLIASIIALVVLAARFRRLDRSDRRRAASAVA